MTEAKICRDMIQNYEDQKNAPYMAILKEEIPTEDLDG